ncbi:hypothetical protein RhiXN_11876 [Rhizoctonia solani]|uniref:Uncharacterized protein n=1 Tax=Rhizoctonia solani TaxID=456999 RepID=A0A8H8P6L5_9AGAM|nr:uncharacterized protein RhiXN_11876 [Rhizoctonia solani]QRW26215.1 hypothetical protein RhiXN_11876 [Rhizoctonia solani]
MSSSSTAHSSILHPISSDYTDSQDGTDHTSNHWWMRAVSIRRLQYAFGQKLDLNSRWFNIYLRSDLHLAFDNKKNPGWVLVPLEADVQQIISKIDALKQDRESRGNCGPWPDFWSREWFPVKKSGYTYEFMPLFVANKDIAIMRYEWDQAEPRQDLYYPPFSDFPLLKSHVHPYAVIFNAQLLDLGYVYDSLANASNNAAPPGLYPLQRGSSRSSPAGTTNNHASQTPQYLETPNSIHEVDCSQTPVGSQRGSGQDNLNHLFDDLEHEPSKLVDHSLGKSLSVSTPNGLIPSLSPSPSLSSPSRVSFA